MIVVSRHANRMGVSAARPVKKLGSLRQDEVASAADPVAPVIQSREIELVADIRAPGASNFTKQTHSHVRIIGSVMMDADFGAAQAAEIFLSIVGAGTSKE